MKKLITLLMALVMIFAATGAFAADIKVLVNGEEIQFDRTPFVDGESVMVPFRFVAEKLGAVVAWDGETQTVFSNVGETLSTMQIGNSNLFVNGEAIALDKAPVLTTDRTLVSMQVIEKALSVTAAWDEDAQTVTITK